MSNKFYPNHFEVTSNPCFFQTSSHFSCTYQIYHLQYQTLFNLTPDFYCVLHSHGAVISDKKFTFPCSICIPLSWKADSWQSTSSSSKCYPCLLGTTNQGNLLNHGSRERERERESTLHISMCYHFIYPLHLKHIFILQFWFQRSKKKKCVA